MSDLTSPVIEPNISRADSNVAFTSTGRFIAKHLGLCRLCMLLGRQPCTYKIDLKQERTMVSLGPW